MLHYTLNTTATNGLYRHWNQGATLRESAQDKEYTLVDGVFSGTVSSQHGFTIRPNPPQSTANSPQSTECRFIPSGSTIRIEESAVINLSDWKQRAEAVPSVFLHISPTYECLLPNESSEKSYQDAQLTLYIQAPQWLAAPLPSQAFSQDKESSENKPLQSDGHDILSAQNPSSTPIQENNQAARTTFADLVKDIDSSQRWSPSSQHDSQPVSAAKHTTTKAQKKYRTPPEELDSLPSSTASLQVDSTSLKQYTQSQLQKTEKYQPQQPTSSHTQRRQAPPEAKQKLEKPTHIFEFLALPSDSDEQSDAAPEVPQDTHPEPYNKLSNEKGKVQRRKNKPKRKTSSRAAKVNQASDPAQSDSELSVKKSEPPEKHQYLINITQNIIKKVQSWRDAIKVHTREIQECQKDISTLVGKRKKLKEKYIQNLKVKKKASIQEEVKYLIKEIQTAADLLCQQDLSENSYAMGITKAFVLHGLNPIAMMNIPKETWCELFEIFIKVYKHLKHIPCPDKHDVLRQAFWLYHAPDSSTFSNVLKQLYTESKLITVFDQRPAEGGTPERDLFYRVQDCIDNLAHAILFDPENFEDNLQKYLNIFELVRGELDIKKQGHESIRRIVPDILFMTNLLRHGTIFLLKEHKITTQKLASLNELYASFYQSLEEVNQWLQFNSLTYDICYDDHLEPHHDISVSIEKSRPAWTLSKEIVTTLRLLSEYKDSFSEIKGTELYTDLLNQIYAINKESISVGDENDKVVVFYGLYITIFPDLSAVTEKEYKAKAVVKSFHLLNQPSQLISVTNADLPHFITQLGFSIDQTEVSDCLQNVLRAYLPSENPENTFMQKIKDEIVSHFFPEVTPEKKAGHDDQTPQETANEVLNFLETKNTNPIQKNPGYWLSHAALPYIANAYKRNMLIILSKHVASTEIAAIYYPTGYAQSLLLTEDNLRGLIKEPKTMENLVILAHTSPMIWTPLKLPEKLMTLPETTPCKKPANKTTKQ